MSLLIFSHGLIIKQLIRSFKSKKSNTKYKIKLSIVYIAEAHECLACYVNSDTNYTSAVKKNWTSIRVSLVLELHPFDISLSPSLLTHTNIYSLTKTTAIATTNYYCYCYCYFISIKLTATITFTKITFSLLFSLDTYSSKKEEKKFNLFILKTLLTLQSQLILTTVSNIIFFLTFQILLKAYFFDILLNSSFL